MADRDSFHKTDEKVLTKDGRVVVLHAGSVVRMNNWSEFADNIILGFNEFGEAKVSRPYAYVSSAGTTGPTVLMGAETYVLPVAHIAQHFQIMCSDGHRAS